MSAQSTAIKIVVGIAALGALGVLFVRSAQTTRAEPYDVRSDRLQSWGLEVDPAPSRSGVLLELRSKSELAHELFNQVFQRSGESMSGPNPAAIPLVLTNEIANSGLAPDTLLEMATAAGLESPMLMNPCMAYRRESAPGMTRQVYFLRFASAPFDAFRRQLGERVRGTGAGSFDPAALSPVLIIASSDAAFDHWLPLAKGATDDCIAPLQIRPAPG